MVVSHDVLNILSPKGVHGLLLCIIDSAHDIIRDKHEENWECHDVAENAIKEGVILSRFGWMPAEWAIHSTDKKLFTVLFKWTSNKQKLRKTS